MPTFATDEQWTVVRRRGDRRGDRGWTGRRRSPRRNISPSRASRRTYASAVRGEHRYGESDLFHASHRGRMREQPTIDRYAARQENGTGRDRRLEQRTTQDNWDRRGDRGWASGAGRDRSPRRNISPPRDNRRTYASVVRGEHRYDEPDLLHAPQRSRMRERPATDHYTARQASWTGRDRRFQQMTAQDNWDQRGNDGWTTGANRRRSPRRNSFPSRDNRRMYASVGRGEHRYDEPDLFYAPQRNRRREQPATDRHAARQNNRAGRDRRFEQRTTQNNRYVKPTRTERAGPPANKILSDDPDFSMKVRIMHRLIKAVHHLKYVAGDNGPPSLNKITQNLMTVIKPAIPNKMTQNKIEANAKNWAHTAILILREHYTQSIEKEIKTLSEFPIQDWGGPFEIATSWAKRNLGRRLQPESLEQARAEIMVKMAELRAATETVEMTTASEPVRQPQGNERMGQLDIIGPLTEVHEPPATITTSKTTSATMTDHVTGDWSLFSEGEQDKESEPTLTAPPETPQMSEPAPAAPRDQRVKGTVVTSQETPIQEFSPSPLSPPIQPPQPVEEMNTEVLDLTQGESTPQKTKQNNTATVTEPQRVTHLGPRRSNVDRLNSCVQTQLQLRITEEPSPSSSPPSPASSEQQVRTPTRHPNTRKKLKDWHLHIKEPWIIVGDSNVSRLPPFADDSLQIDSFPGAKWWHAENLLERATTDTSVTTLVLSFGINNRSQRDKNVPILELKRALRAAREKFPEADIFVPEINFSSALPQVEQDTLLHLNAFITGLKNHIPALTPDIFTTEGDDIHWSRGTSEAMLQHWEMYLNGQSP